jgi:hypothetical protein
MSRSVHSVRLVAFGGVAEAEAEPSTDARPQPDPVSSQQLASRSNRRGHQRLGARDLEWLTTARVKYGQEVRLIDVSTGGMAVETQRQLTPHSTIVFELAGPTGGVLVAACVLRSERVDGSGDTLYRSACVFKRPLELSRLNSRMADSARGSQKPHAGAEASPSANAAAAPAPSWQKVVVRYRDGRILRGFTNDFNASRPQLHMSSDPLSGDALIVPLNQLKALFFVRDFAGDPTYVEQKTFASQPQGRKLEVTFEDGEVLVGTTLSYRPEGHGFFVHPADKQANNLRVFVTSVGVRHVRFLARG